MKINNILYILLSLAVAGCVTEEIVYNVQRDESFKSYIVQSDNENLADVAARFTGSASNWQLIANYNPEIDSYRLKRGDKITIPESLLIDVPPTAVLTWQGQETPEPTYTVEPTIEPTGEPTPEIEIEAAPTPAIVVSDLNLSPYDLEDRRNLRNEILSDILND